MGGCKHLALQTDDVDGVAARLMAAGVEFTLEPLDAVGGVRLAQPIRSKLRAELAARIGKAAGRAGVALALVTELADVIDGGRRAAWRGALWEVGSSGAGFATAWAVGASAAARYCRGGRLHVCAAASLTAGIGGFVAGEQVWRRTVPGLWDE